MRCLLGRVYIYICEIKKHFKKKAPPACINLCYAVRKWSETAATAMLMTTIRVMLKSLQQSVQVVFKSVYCVFVCVFCFPWRSVYLGNRAHAGGTVTLQKCRASTVYLAWFIMQHKAKLICAIPYLYLSLAMHDTINYSACINEHSLLIWQSVT